MAFKIRSRAKWALSFLQHYRFAMDEYKNVLQNASGVPVGKKTARLIKEYSRYQLGDIRYFPWLYVYSAYRGEFIEGWLPKNFVYQDQLINDMSFREISEKKTMSKRILGTDRLPDIAYYVNGLWLDSNFNTLRDSEVSGLLFGDGDTVIAKRDDSRQGKGVVSVDASDFDLDALSGKGDFVIQTRVRQHPVFDEFSKDSVATLRIITARSVGKKPTVRAALLRVGRKGERSTAADSLIKIAVSGHLGALHDWGVNKKWERFDRHPDTGAEFRSVVVPGYSGAIALCENLHLKLQNIPIIGWDIVIDEDEQAQLIEWNASTPGVVFAEASVGPCFSDLWFGD